MKHLSPLKAQRLIRVAAERERRTFYQRRATKERQRLGLAFEATPSQATPRSQDERVHILFPQSVSLAPAEYPQLIDFISKLRKSALTDGRRVMIDMRQCVKFSPEIAPLLVAELQRIKFFKGDGFIAGTSPKSAECRRTLHLMGFFDALQMHDPLADKEGDDTSIGSLIRTGTTLDGEVSKVISDEFGRALDLHDGQKERVLAALNDALENISEHAYFDKELLAFPAELGRWWISSIAADRRAFLLACDLGSTIPATVPKTAKKRGIANQAALKALLDMTTATEDEKLLAAAFEDGVTRRPDGKGGRGLGKMRDLVDEFEEGQLTVFSGRAMALFVKGASKVQTHPLKGRFDGTYVLWSIGRGAAQ